MVCPQFGKMPSLRLACACDDDDEPAGGGLAGLGGEALEGFFTAFSSASWLPRGREREKQSNTNPPTTTTTAAGGDGDGDDDDGCARDY